MPNSRYQAGARFERLIVERLGLLGYAAVRAAGSKGPADVWAARESRLILVQCKRSGRLEKSGRQRLERLAEVTGGVPCLAEIRPGSGVWITYLEDGREVA